MVVLGLDPRINPATQLFIGQNLGGRIKCDNGEKGDKAQLESEWV
jgi:hypothetical protein